MTTVTIEDAEALMVTPRYFYVTPMGIAEWVEKKGFIQAMREISKLRRTFSEMYPDEKLLEVVIKNGEEYYLMTRKGERLKIQSEVPSGVVQEKVMPVQDFLKATELESYSVNPTDF